MNVFRMSTEKDNQGYRCYRALLAINEENRTKMDEYETKDNLFHGASVINVWKPIQVQSEENLTYWEPPLPFGDLSMVHGVFEPVFSLRAVNALNNLLEGNGELLPLNCAEGEYYVFNTTQIVDALDEERTEFKPYSEVDPDMAYQDDDPHTPVITRPAFYPEVVADLTIFKIPLRYPFGGTLVTDKFVQRVQETELTGFAFELLWSR
jgi:hypothetical protein